MQQQQKYFKKKKKKKKNLQEDRTLPFAMIMIIDYF